MLAYFFLNQHSRASEWNHSVCICIFFSGIGDVDINLAVRNSPYEQMNSCENDRDWKWWICPNGVSICLDYNSHNSWLLTTLKLLSYWSCGLKQSVGTELQMSHLIDLCKILHCDILGIIAICTQQCRIISYKSTEKRKYVEFICLSEGKASE